jgi:hypothetical protein
MCDFCMPALKDEASIFGQHDIKKDKDGVPPVRYGAIRKGLVKVSVFAIYSDTWKPIKW